ncbi:MAG: fibronectin type III domain-containing protein [Lachnospiraceae bacterium]|nr:fibronectin type III domain-containing protein [Lachnospiraceae bacterium]
MNKVKTIIVLFAITFLYGILAGSNEASADGNFTQVTLAPVVTRAPEGTDIMTTPGPLYTESPISTFIPVAPTYAPIPTPVPTLRPYVTPSPVVTKAPYNEYYKEMALKMDIKSANFNVKRVSGKKVNLKWKKVAGADGYLIAYSEKENGTYTKIKYIYDSQKTTYTIKKLKSKKIYYYKLAAFQSREGMRYYSYYSSPVQAETYKTQKIYNKLMSIKRGFPQGMYWNHVGYKTGNSYNTSSYVTFKPCKHSKTTSTCNRYRDRDGVLGIQCYGFAGFVSDTLFKNAKCKHHRSFKKAKVGDHVRYNNDKHSVIIMEKHKDYIIVCECNYGGTCMLNWGRVIYKKDLAGALYHTRY